jgi:hypothetical protein
MKWIAAGLILVIVIAVGAWWYEGHRAEIALMKQPVYRVLHEHERPLYAEIVKEYQVYLRNEEKYEQFLNFAHGRIAETATRALATASQDAQLAMIRDMLATARTLQGKPDDACFRFWFPKVSGPPDIARWLDAGAQERSLGLMGEVIRSAAESPVPQPAAETVQDSLAEVVNGTYQQFGADAQMLAHAEDPRVDRAKVCTITIGFYERVLRLAPPRASALIRVMAQ